MGPGRCSRRNQLGVLKPSSFSINRVRDGSRLLLLRGTECTLQLLSEIGQTRPDMGERIKEEAEARWYALYTRARHEKQADRRLRQREFESFLPLFPRMRQWHDRKKVVHWPLFPGYVFARFGLDALTRVLSTPGVATVVRHNGAPAPISDVEIQNVQRFAEAIGETGIPPEPTQFVQVDRGQHVRIVSGRLKGVEGLVVERRGRGKVLVQIGIQAIGQGLKVEVAGTSIKKVTDD